MPAPKELIELVKRFERNLEVYKSGRYNETQVRREFIDPFFEILGWDINNKQGYAEAYKEVVHEDSIKVAGGTKAPDYCFRIGGARKFFLEAKKPSIDVKKDVHPAYQVRRYAWSSKLPLSILTDFEELAIYDCRVKPDKADKASFARVNYITYKEYVERWDEIASVFSREAILKGSFDKYINSNKKKRGTAEVDDVFLKEIESWRELLAKNIAIKNPKLSQSDLNFAVQRIIDRIIFLRICEDRGIENYGRLMALQNGNNTYGRLCELFREADEKYNSGLFHFKEEKDMSTHTDELTLGLKIEDSPLKNILKRLYYPDSPYEFSVLPADILGQVYEQFLGKVIRLTSGHKAVIEEKPEVRKAGGVYYTPTYIVDYIVENTVGKLVKGKTPKQITKIKILDPACGSGSFLIGAYQYLLDWHRDWYVKDGAKEWAKKKKPVLYQDSKEEWQLTTTEKKRILLNNIYGVDIDSQAVEVTKLSLLLKVLEGETDPSLKTQLRIFHERVLPDLGNNIKCGNSLVGTDFYKDKNLSLFNDEEMKKINAFDWNDSKKGFGEIMTNGGFDVVIGNPPYTYRNATNDKLINYYSNKYVCLEGNFDLYKFFLEKGVSLIKEKGLLGMIISATFLIQSTFKKLRRLLLQQHIETLLPLGPNVFDNATVDTTIIIVRKHSKSGQHKIATIAPKTPKDLFGTKAYYISQKRFINNENQVFDYRLTDESANIVNKMFNNNSPLERYFDIGVGINTGYIKKELVSNNKKDKCFHPMVSGKGISRYGKVITSGWIMYDKEYVKSRGSLGRSLPEEKYFQSEKILLVRTRNLSLERRIIATLDTQSIYNLNRLSNIIAKSKFSLKGLLGILNSSLMNWLFSTRFYDYEIKPIYLRTIPIADVNNKTLINYVGHILDVQQHMNSAKIENDKKLYQQKIDILNKQIDNLVYKLYELTKEEVKIVEGK